MLAETQDEAVEKPIRALRGTEADLRAMKRALAHAPLGPTATLALTSAIVALEEEIRSESTEADHVAGETATPQTKRA